MRRLLAVVAAAALIGIVVPAAPAAAASCTTVSTTAVTGGYRARIDCTDVGMTIGFGSTVGHAQQQAALLVQLNRDTGLRCGGFTVNTVAAGGYSVRTDCFEIGMTIGFGSTVTDAQVESRSLVELYADTGRECDSFTSTRSGAVYRVRIDCLDVGMVIGDGGTLTQAAQNARLLASIS